MNSDAPARPAMVTAAMIEAGKRASNRVYVSGPDLKAIYLAMHQAANGDVVERPSLMSESFAVLRDACEADQRNSETWARISPEEARHVRADLAEARAAIASLLGSRIEG